MGMQHRVLRRAMKGALTLLYPPQCIGCGVPVAGSAEGDTGLCPDCWRETRFITGTACNRCGAPLPDDGTGRADDESLICDDCLAIARPWRHGRAAVVYSGTGRGLILALKHGDRPDLAPFLAGWLSRSAAPLLRPGMVIAPVPLHLRRLMKRRYNQAALVSAHLARLRGLQHMPDLLIRHRHTQGQDHRNVSDRFANIAGALGVNPRRSARIEGRAVLLVDDVMTSGATLAAAAEALLTAGSGPISVAVLARAVKDD
ncbi:MULTISPECIES: double zinc ribbon domain-containing protein [unclassified Paracoccus (in: a-proteobacteria)]|uniref:double zinc ribbon domain-containing protein n=1 Tax=unclassified Paracoccus (in: a-proteobacteria) TaxID=2688777 RepID=UPI001FFE217F|nr:MULTISPECIES: double zinc ribbon domain-containing protein [unclassified Paracoccus (in: a-proteobacteria)]